MKRITTMQKSVEEMLNSIDHSQSDNEKPDQALVKMANDTSKLMKSKMLLSVPEDSPLSEEIRGSSNRVDQQLARIQQFNQKVETQQPAQHEQKSAISRKNAIASAVKSVKNSIHEADPSISIEEKEIQHYTDALNHATQAKYENQSDSPESMIEVFTQNAHHTTDNEVEPVSSDLMALTSDPSLEDPQSVTRPNVSEVDEDVEDIKDDFEDDIEDDIEDNVESDVEDDIEVDIEDDVEDDIQQDDDSIDDLALNDENVQSIDDDQHAIEEGSQLNEDEPSPEEQLQVTLPLLVSYYNVSTQQHTQKEFFTDLILKGDDSQSKDVEIPLVDDNSGSLTQLTLNWFVKEDMLTPHLVVSYQPTQSKVKYLLDVEVMKHIVGSNDEPTHVKTYHFETDGEYDLKTDLINWQTPMFQIQDFDNINSGYKLQNPTVLTQTFKPTLSEKPVTKETKQIILELVPMVFDNASLEIIQNYQLPDKYMADGTTLIDGDKRLYDLFKNSDQLLIDLEKEAYPELQTFLKLINDRITHHIHQLQRELNLDFTSSKYQADDLLKYVEFLTTGDVDQLGCEQSVTLPSISKVSLGYNIITAYQIADEIFRKILENQQLAFILLNDKHYLVLAKLESYQAKIKSFGNIHNIKCSSYEFKVCVGYYN